MADGSDVDVAGLGQEAVLREARVYTFDDACSRVATASCNCFIQFPPFLLPSLSFFDLGLGFVYQ